MSTVHVLPPYRSLSEPRPLTTAQVLENIQSYLASSATQAHLHPDCIFTERIGPTFSSAADTGGLVLQQLRRLEAGLRGEWMGVVDPQFELSKMAGKMEEQAEAGVQEELQEQTLPGGDDATLETETVHIHGVTEAPENTRGGKRRKTGVTAEMNGIEEAVGGGAGDDDEVANYQLQLGQQREGIFAGEIGERTNVVGNVKSAPRIKSTVPTSNGVKRQHENTVVEGGKRSKDERKAAKQARNKERKAQVEKERVETTQQEDHIQQEREDVDMEDAVSSEPPAPALGEPEDDEAKRKAEKHARKLAKAQKNKDVK